MNREELIEKYVESSKDIENEYKKYSEEIISFRPNIDDAWTIKEHIIHVVDCDINISIYIKSILAQPKSTMYKIDGKSWIDAFGTKNLNIKNYVIVFGLIKENIYELLIDVDDQIFEKEYLILPYNGEMIQLTIKDCLESSIRHIKYHLEYINRNINEYRKQLNLYASPSGRSA